MCRFYYLGMDYVLTDLYFELIFFSWTFVPADTRLTKLNGICFLIFRVILYFCITRLVGKTFCIVLINFSELVTIIKISPKYLHHFWYVKGVFTASQVFCFVSFAFLLIRLGLISSMGVIYLFVSTSFNFNRTSDLFNF